MVKNKEKKAVEGKKVNILGTGSGQGQGWGWGEVLEQDSEVMRSKTLAVICPGVKARCLCS